MRLDEAAWRDADTCEVCRTKWKQEYELPKPPEPMTKEQFDERAQTLLLMAYMRTHQMGGMRPRDNDALILRELGPYYNGPWTKQPSLLRRMSSGIKRLIPPLRRGSSASSLSGQQQQEDGASSSSSAGPV